MTPSSSGASPTAVTLSRRTFLAGAGATTLAGLVTPSLFPRYAFATPNQPGQGDVLVLIFLRGGADGLSIVPPYSDEAGYQQLRGSVAIPAPGSGQPAGASCLDLSGTHPHELGGHTFGFHPAMAGTPTTPEDPEAVGDGGLRAVWEQGHLAVVHAVGFDASSTSRSHFDAQDHWDRASGSPAVTSGWLARYLEKVMPAQGDIAGLAWGTNVQASLRSHPSVASVQSLAEVGLVGYADEARSLEALRELYPGTSPVPIVAQGATALDVVDRVDVADPFQYEPDAGLYPASALGSGLKQIAMMIRADVGLRVACIDMGAWDLHNGMGTSAAGAMRNQVLGLADAMHAFHQDLNGAFGEAAVIDEVTTVALSEFGRTINVNGNGGTDHGRGNAMYVMGNHVVPGLHGAYPGGPLVDGSLGDLEVGTDFRTVLTELLVKRLDLAPGDLGHVLPAFSSPGDLGVFQ
jgi:uncharacterized protein (DUF1501 family)